MMLSNRLTSEKSLLKLSRLRELESSQPDSYKTSKVLPFPEQPMTADKLYQLQEQCNPAESYRFVSEGEVRCQTTAAPGA